MTLTALAAAGADWDPPPSEWDRTCRTWAQSTARPEQKPPPADWLIWLILAGRGFGKTRTGAEDTSDYTRTHPGARVALVAQTFTDGRDTMVEGESGLLAILPDTALRGGSRDSAWNRSLGELFFSNGSRAKVYSAEKPGQLRGPQHHRAWVDEPAKFKDAHKGDTLDTTWNNLMLGLRLGEHPQAVVTGTPTNCRLVRHLLARAEGEHPHVVVTRGSTYDNLPNLAPTFRAEILAAYEGTRIGRQELLGELLDDVEGALWTQVGIDSDRVDNHPDLTSVVVAIDPAGGTADTNDETGIVVAGVDTDGHGYTLEDLSGRYSPHDWARTAIGAYHRWQADRIVAEKNYGGDMVEATLRAAGFAGGVQVVTASRGKQQRAEPVAALYEQHRVHHVGGFPQLEDQMCSWTADSGTSPDRMDALVWAFSQLMLGYRPTGARLHVSRR